MYFWIKEFLEIVAQFVLIYLKLDLKQNLINKLSENVFKALLKNNFNVIYIFNYKK